VPVPFFPAIQSWDFYRLWLRDISPIRTLIAQIRRTDKSDSKTFFALRPFRSVRNVKDEENLESEKDDQRNDHKGESASRASTQ